MNISSPVFYFYVFISSEKNVQIYWLGDRQQLWNLVVVAARSACCPGL
jgi:hypothetical protein